MNISIKDKGDMLRAHAKATGRRVMTTVSPTRRVWHYSGDTNIEHGGMFYCLATFDDGYIECWRCQPCSDAGGPDNMYWIDHLSVNIRSRRPFEGVGSTVAERRVHRVLHDTDSADGARIEEALRCCGWGEELGKWDKLTRAERVHAIVDACVSYGLYDQESSKMIRVGPKQETRGDDSDDWQQEPEVILHANTNLRKYVRGLCGE